MATMFKRLGIPTGEVAFYNHPAFLEAERSDPSLLEHYAAWVRARKMDRAYLDHARMVVPKIAQTVAREILRDGQTGVCMDASMMITKMLEEQGIWCYAAKGALSVNHPGLGDPTYFWFFDEMEVPGHVWVVAPPFEVVDVVLKAQPYSRGEDALLPEYVVLESITRVTSEAADYCSGKILREAFEQYGPLPPDVHLQLFPDIKKAAGFFPSFDICFDEASLRYSVAGVTMSTAPSLQAIKSRTWNGLSAAELYESIVVPAIAAG